MPRIFRHYVPYCLLALLTMEGWVVFASTFASLHVPRIGLPAMYPGPGPLVPKTLVLSLLVLMMLHLWELSYLAPGLSLGRRACQVVLFGKGSR